jgi:hypothetical protein
MDDSAAGIAMSYDVRALLSQLRHNNLLQHKVQQPYCAWA